ncbi:MAG: cellulase family glycosylhydrolase [Verrucomicrobiota bacterium]
MNRPVVLVLLALCCGGCAWGGTLSSAGKAPLPKIQIRSDGQGFVTAKGKPFVPFGLTYFRSGTGWAPQVWKKFDADATRRDFVRMKELGVNCVRVFISYGSFYPEPGKLEPEGLAKFDVFLKLAEEQGIYVHPTGPDHWEGSPEWARGDRMADERALAATETFWRLFAARYQGRSVIFGYDLRNEPEMGWDGPVMLKRWNDWLRSTYATGEQVGQAWAGTNQTFELGSVPIPQAKDAPGSRELLDYQRFREDLADEWTRRQVSAIKAADPQALVTVGLIQWSVPSLLPGVRHYAGFRPERQAKLLDFMEIHFYPLDRGAYEYRNDEEEARNLAYLQGVVGEVARTGKPVVVAEYGWYGGGKPRFDGGKHPFASEEQQARWCRKLVETTAGPAFGWLNWGLYDQPEATDPSEFSGLLTADGKLKAWGREFQQLARQFSGKRIASRKQMSTPALDWDACLTSAAAGNRFREQYYQALQPAHSRP